MKKFYTLLKYEIYRLMVSPATYVVASIFTLSMGGIFIFLLHDYIKFAQDIPLVQMFCRCFWLPTCVVVPLLSMRSFSEEYKSGTFQNLFSVPVTYTEVVLAKFFAVYGTFIFLWLCSLSIFVAVGARSEPIVRELAFASPFNMGGGLLFIAITGLLFVAIGIFASSLTENQIISCMVTFFILLALFIGEQFFANRSQITNLNLYGTYQEALNIFSQLDNFCNGVFDTRIVVFYLSTCVLTLCFSTLVVQRKLN
ncbi:MAG: ABC transporter permease [Puniceicoccales bacterium]|nr:ABC transporter permease [Puniceicoccales bacterium]